MKKHGIFRKMFLYTLLFVVLTIFITIVLFAQQFKAFYENAQMQQLNIVFQPLTNKLEEKSMKQIIEAARDFHEKNQSFEFYIESIDEKIIYMTPNAYQIVQHGNNRIIMLLPGNFKLYATNTPPDVNIWNDLIGKTFFALIILLTTAVAGTFIFARGITNPIRKLVADTQKMSALEPISAPPFRDDELGQLAYDIHKMYEKLKHTISSLENEIKLEKEMEENQRYFFSAASHELKTPIAAIKAVIEGMLADIGDYKNHTKYLRECLKMLNAQNVIIVEILDIVNLSNEQIQINLEKTNLSKLLSIIMPEYLTLAESKEQILTIDIPKNVFCYTNMTLLGRAISNIIMNAIQNTPKHGTISIWCETEHTDTIRLCIFNSDSHIDEEALSKLFEPFYRVDKARSRSANRSGLGLTIVKKILNNMEIPFSLENAASGVLFWMDLPVND